MVKARETNLIGVLEGTKQYQVPLYQRTYSWGRKQIDQLWDDVLDITDARQVDASATHFIGSLVLASSPDFAAVGLNKFLVVDGQQRLTTLTLLLAALRDHQASAEGDHHRARIDDQYLLNKYERGQPLKLWPTQADRASYEAVVRATSNAGGDDAVGHAYNAFRSKLAQIDDLDEIARIESTVLRGLALVAVTAEPGDNAHRIFESLNNTGLRLTQADLLKNYLFMRLGDRTDQVYTQVWRPLEQKLSSEALELLFWLDLVQTDELAKQSDTYLGQQRRFSKFTTPTEVEAEVRRIAKLGELLALILKPEGEPNPSVRRRLERIHAWGSTTAYPVVMQILLQRADGRASDGQAERALLVLESYFVRRIVIGRATANLNRTLLQATSAIADADEVDVALRRYLSTGRKYFGTDAQVRDSVGTVAFYWQGRASQKKLILLWLEDTFGSKEKIDPTNLTIEHVLPQTPSAEVMKEFGQGVPENDDPSSEYERIVHTLGNLTLSGYNSELSNAPFSSKRTHLSKSGIRLSQEIVANESWSVREVEARGKALADLIIQTWPGPVETATPAADAQSEAAVQVRSACAAIPAGRWTSYGELALVLGLHPMGVGNIVATYPIDNAWRVLQSGGTVSPQFHWLDEERTDDPIDILREEGVEFDEKRRASKEQFLDAVELAELLGLETDSLGVARRSFWERVRTQGLSEAPELSWGADATCPVLVRHRPRAGRCRD